MPAGRGDLLAEAIVEEVKARGPFRSMAEFVNRKLNGTADQQRKGALQAALDLTVNNPAATSAPSTGPSTEPAPPSITTRNSGRLVIEIPTQSPRPTPSPRST